MVGAWVSGSSRARVVLVCGLLVGVAVLPVAQSHTAVTDGGNPSGSPTSLGRHGLLGLPHNDPCRYYQPPCENHEGISGTYTSSGGFWYNPPFRFASTSCDLEILSDGSGKPDPADETNVDGWENTAGTPDAIWDDGGIGGACHTSGHYLKGEYNSPGCGTTHHTSAHGSDAVLGDDVNIIAGCDWKSTAGPGGLLSYTACVSNAILGGQPGKITGECQDILDCIINPILCPGDFVGCGANGAVDALTFGLGGGHDGGFTFPAASLISDDGCTQADSSAFIWAVNGATTGWLHSTGGGGGGEPCIWSTREVHAFYEVGTGGDATRVEWDSATFKYGCSGGPTLWSNTGGCQSGAGWVAVPAGGTNPSTSDPDNVKAQKCEWFCADSAVCTGDDPRRLIVMVHGFNDGTYHCHYSSDGTAVPSAGAQQHCENGH